MSAFYIPSTKVALVEWFIKNKGWVKARLNQLNKKQLLAMYYKERSSL